MFTILKAIFLAAHDQGIRVLLDGGGGDVVMDEGSYIIRLIRQGRLKLAIAEIIAESRYWGFSSPAPSLLRYARNAFLPGFIKHAARAYRSPSRLRAYLESSLISADFARSVCIEDRYQQMQSIFPSRWTPDYAVEFCDKIRPNMTGGKERYSRIAAATGMEARDPFLDKRVVEYCSRLPGRFRLRDGWPKVILRDITADKLPDEVRWTGRKEHLSWWFSDDVTKLAVARGELDFGLLQERLEGFVDPAALTRAWRVFEDGGNSEPVHHAYVLSTWLRENRARPVVPHR